MTVRSLWVNIDFYIILKIPFAFSASIFARNIEIKSKLMNEIEINETEQQKKSKTEMLSSRCFQKRIIPNH